MFLCVVFNVLACFKWFSYFVKHFENIYPNKPASPWILKQNGRSLSKIYVVSVFRPAAGRGHASYFGRSAMSLTSAMTSLCSSSKCLRRTSFCCRGTDSGQNRHTSSSVLEPCRLALGGCSGKHSGSSMLSSPERRTHTHKPNSCVCVINYLALKQIPILSSDKLGRKCEKCIFQSSYFHFKSVFFFFLNKVSISLTLVSKLNQFSYQPQWVSNLASNVPSDRRSVLVY